MATFTKVPQNQTPLAAIWIIQGLNLIEICYGHTHQWPSISTWIIPGTIPEDY